MPVYIRANDSWTPNSLKDENFVMQDDDFMGDPDQKTDHLPQPYRMIDKVLRNVIDDVWEIANQKESKLIADASRFRPPQYECAVHLEADSSSPIGKAECMTVTKDGEFVLIGLLNGLAVIQAESTKVIDMLVDENIHVTNINTEILTETAHLISTIDDMGQARLYGLAGNQLYLLSTINEGASEKSIVSLSQLSPGGAYLVLHLQKPSSEQSWMEVHKLPRDAWIKDLENIAPQAPTRDANLPDEVETSSGPLQVTKTTDNADDRSQSSRASYRSENRTSHKFAATTVHMKVTPPPEELTACASVGAAVKAMDTNCDVVGTGQNHIITAPHLDHRHSVFSHLHADLMEYMPENIAKPTARLSCHFLKPGFMLPQSLESSSNSGEMSAVSVWWERTTQLHIYNLNKQAKDLERRPDVVLPMSANIVTSCVSVDGSRLVLALDNNNIVVWDAYLGCMRTVRHIDVEGRINSVTILDASVATDSYTQMSYHVMVTMDTGHMIIVNATSQLDPNKHVQLNVVEDEEVPVICQTVQGLPNLLLTTRRNGRVYLHDLHLGNQLCEVTTPPDYQLSSPWQPIICVGANGRMLYLKGEVKPAPATEDEGEGRQVAPPDSVLFVFQLRSFPALDRYRQMEPPTVPDPHGCHVNNVVDNILRDRMLQQSCRVARMQERWSALRQFTPPCN